jgi:hypothetical protein
VIYWKSSSVYWLLRLVLRTRWPGRSRGDIIIWKSGICARYLPSPNYRKYYTTYVRNDFTLLLEKLSLYKICRSWNSSYGIPKMISMNCEVYTVEKMINDWVSQISFSLLTSIVSRNMSLFYVTAPLKLFYCLTFLPLRLYSSPFLIMWFIAATLSST